VNYCSLVPADTADKPVQFAVPATKCNCPLMFAHHLLIINGCAIGTFRTRKGVIHLMSCMMDGMYIEDTLW